MSLLSKILGLFGYLAIFRPWNLYSPQDYGDGESFIQATSKQTFELRKKEAEEMIREDALNKDTNPSSGSEENEAVIKTHQNNNIDESKEERKQSLIKRISKAESIGLRAAEKTLGLRLIPNVMFSNDGRREIEIDGFNQENGIFTIVEIKYTGNHNWKPTVKRGMETLTNYVEYMKKDGRIIQPLLVVVTSLYEAESEIKQFCNEINDNIDCIVVKDS